MSVFEAMLIWVILLIFVDYLDKRGAKPDSSQRRAAIDSALFSTYRRRFVVYFLVFLLIPVEMIRFYFVEFISSPLLYMSYFLILMLIAILGSNYYAKEREKRLRIGN